MALLHVPGIPLATFGAAPPQLVVFMAKQLGLPTKKYADYASPVQILSEHAGDLMLKLNVRLQAEDYLSLMIEAGARAAWSTEDGFDIATCIVGALRDAGILPPNMPSKAWQANPRCPRNRGKIMCPDRVNACRLDCTGFVKAGCRDHQHGRN